MLTPSPTTQRDTKRRRSESNFKGAWTNAATSPLSWYPQMEYWAEKPNLFYCSLEDLSPTSRQMVLAILCRLWLYQGSHEHSHSLCHTFMQLQLPSPHQPNQHSPPSVGGQSRSWIIPTVKNPHFFGQHSTLPQK
jgi:hypothetical protein